MDSLFNTDAMEQARKVALNNALDERTDPIKLRQCIIDLRCHCICPLSWSLNQRLPRLYAVSVSCHGTTVDIYINEYVTVADIFARLVDLRMITKENAFFACLKSSNGQFTFEPYQCISTELNDPQLSVHIGDRPLDEMRIFIKTQTGATDEIRVTPHDSIELVKVKGTVEYGIQVGEQRLFFSSRELQDGRMLSDYNVQKDSVLY